MGKRIFVLIIVLMSIALIGIISVQYFWIINTIDITEKQFTSNVKFSLAKVSDDIKHREFEEFYNDIADRYKEEGTSLEYSDVSKYIFEKIDTATNERFTYSQSIIEANYKVPTEFFENDSIDFKEIFTKEEFVLIKSPFFDNSGETNPEERFEKVGRFNAAEKAILQKSYNAITSRIPIHNRVSNREITSRLEKELKSRGINTNFKYGIYSNGLATPVKSGYFRKEVGKSYMVPIFADENGNSNFQLFVTFPEKKNFIMDSMVTLLSLSGLFILIIIMTFVVALYQLIRQKQISEIKTDFINNMTHEFKTPIATINLALDAIKNPKIIDDKEKVFRYVKMIRDENKRMHGQVENVLRISKLEKNQLEISKDKVDIHELIEDAVMHVGLLVNDRNGTIDFHFNADLTEFLGNQFHFTNIIVNMLENAIKYSDEEPKIDIYTENTAKNIIFKIQDQGVGMSKQAQKLVFKKFYREEKGNVHNVKGHGLGLSYVKKIIEIHQGHISVESEKGVGSTFTVKLPLI